MPADLGALGASRLVRYLRPHFLHIASTSETGIPFKESSLM